MSDSGRVILNKDIVELIYKDLEVENKNLVSAAEGKRFKGNIKNFYPLIRRNDEKGISVTDTAKEIGCSTFTIAYARKKLGLTKTTTTITRRAALNKLLKNGTDYQYRIGVLAKKLNVSNALMAKDIAKLIKSGVIEFGKTKGILKNIKWVGK